MTKIDCIQFKSEVLNVWLISIKDKMFGEMKALEELRRKAQQFDLELNWLIYDIVDQNKAVIDERLQDVYTSGETELTEDEKQLVREGYVRDLISGGKFGNSIFSAFRYTIAELLASSDRKNRVIETVLIGLKNRFVKDVYVKTGDRSGYVLSADVKSGQTVIGLTDQELESLQADLGFVESLIESVYDFLQAEYVGINYLETINTTNDDAEDETDKTPQLLTGEVTEDDDQKKPDLL